MTRHALLETLRKALGLLEADGDLGLQATIAQLCDTTEDSPFRIVVFGPFNYGKSTLLNALLGEKALPIGLVPTTGAAITIQYGPELSTGITLTDGTQVVEPGTDLLKHYATLDDVCRMRDDVLAVEVRCPHPFLQMGVMLVDLPGTDDQATQEVLVKDQLLHADLVVQLLDGRKLMTLGERMQLQDWLLARHLTTVIFVANFLNLMESEEQQAVTQRLRFLAESFRADLPAGVSNLYRVDALPALRARLKGDLAAAQTTGLSTLESALQRIVHSLQAQLAERRRARLRSVIPSVQAALEAQIQKLEAAAQTRQQQQNEKKAALQQKAQRLIQQGFQASVEDLRQWLALSNLLATYQRELALALQQFDLQNWLSLVLRPAWQHKQRAVVGWVYKACEFFDQPRPADLWVAFPEEPEVTVTASPAVDYFQALDQRYAAAAHAYLRDFSMAALKALGDYQIAARRNLVVAGTTSTPLDSRQQAHLSLIRATLAELSEYVAAVD